MYYSSAKLPFLKLMVTSEGAVFYTVLYDQQLSIDRNTKYVFMLTIIFTNSAQCL